MSQNVIAFDPTIPASQIQRIAATLIAGIESYKRLRLDDRLRPASTAIITPRQRIEIDSVARGFVRPVAESHSSGFEILEPLSPDEMDAIAECLSQFLKVDPDPPNDPDPES